jgi:hypothetical protein
LVELLLHLFIWQVAILRIISIIQLAFGEAGGAGAFSTSSFIFDCVLRSKVSSPSLLQSGGGASAITKNSAYNVTVANTLAAATLQQGDIGVSTLIVMTYLSYTFFWWNSYRCY